MIKNLLLLSFSVVYFSLFSQSVMNQVGYLPYSQDLSDVWGYVDSTGKEYALVGVYNGFSIVDIDTPSNPKQVQFISGSSTVWRDIKVWGDYAYVTSEGNDALLIVDLSGLPGTVQTYTRSPLGMSSAHNIFIDEQGRGFIVGADVNVGGAIIVDIAANPTNPPVLAHYTNYYMHDIFVRGDTMWGAMINDGFVMVVDISNLNTINQLSNVMGVQNTPSNYAHNVWLSDNNNHMFTTDERSNAFIGAYDVSNLANIDETDRIQSSPGQNVIPHNTFFSNNFLFTSYYRDGVTVHDAKVPQNLVQTEFFDTSPNFSGDGFNGCWGVYPYLPSGLILATDIEEGLYILGTNNFPASRITGVVKDSLCGSRLRDVEVNVLNSSGSGQSNIIGRYYAGQPDSGRYDVQFSKNGYQTKLVSNVHFRSGEMDTLDIQLVPLNTLSMDILVVDSATGAPMPDVQILFTQGGNPVYSGTTDAQGRYTDCTFGAGTYDLYWGKWAYKTRARINFNIADPTYVDTLRLSKGYYDDFTFDFGWTDSSTASTGAWEIGDPTGTTYFGDQANPEDDVTADFLNQAYVTGNGGGQVGDDDIDGGNVILRSPPIDLDFYNDPIIDFSYWFYNDGGSGSPNDFIEVSLIGDFGQQVLFSSSNSNSGWTDISLRVKQFIQDTGIVSLEVFSLDQSPGHIVEAGFDYFRMREWQHPSCAQQLQGNADTFYTGTGPCLKIFAPLSNDLIPQLDSTDVYLLTGTKLGTTTLKDSGIFEYVSNVNQDTTDWFEYVICNYCPTCDTVRAVIDIDKASSCIKNTPPYFSDGLSTNPVKRDTLFSVQDEIDSLCTLPLDPDGDSVYLDIVEQGKNGTLSFYNDSCLIYQPNLNFIGWDSMAIAICDDGQPFLCDTMRLVIQKAALTGLGSLQSGELIVFPNPGKDKFRLSLMENKNISVQLFDMLGKELINGDIFDRKNWVSPNLSGLPNGLYLIRVTGDGLNRSILWEKE